MTPLRHPRYKSSNRTPAGHTDARSICVKAASLLAEISGSAPRTRNSESRAKDAIYHGWRKPDGQFTVIVEEQSGAYRPLQHLTLHSPNGFAWGYDGNGPRDTARSLLAHALGDPEIYSSAEARKKYPADTGEQPDDTAYLSIIRNTDIFLFAYLKFTTEVVADLSQDQSWSLSRSEILSWLTGLHHHSPPPADSSPPLPLPPCDSSACHRPARARRSRRS